MNHAASVPANILRIAVVGHTNTGKTSLLRTLTRDTTFGEVSDRPATTRHVEGATLIVGGRPLIELYDTPGLEDSIGLLEHLDSLRGEAERRIDGVELIQRFLDGPESNVQTSKRPNLQSETESFAHPTRATHAPEQDFGRLDVWTFGRFAPGRFAQEAKALRQVLASDLALYVIDARDPVLAKHRDELEILARCARPVVPVLNFTASEGAQVKTWREHLARANMHAVAEFDTVVLDEHSERRLLEKMRSLLDRHHETIDALIAERARQRQRLVRASAELVADLLIDVAAFTLVAPADDKRAAEEAIESLKTAVRGREQDCVQALLELHRFRAADYDAAEFPLADGKWGVDLFHPAAMKQFGVRTGGGAAAGALAGLTIDAMVGGITLGAAAAVGAAIGALFGAGHTHGRRLLDRARGRSELRCDDATLRLLMLRQTSLIQALLRRGHASLAPIRLEGQVSGVRSQVSGGDDQGSATAQNRERMGERQASLIVNELGEARIRRHWSRLTAPHDANPAALAGAARRALQEKIANEIANAIAA